MLNRNSVRTVTALLFVCLIVPIPAVGQSFYGALISVVQDSAETALNSSTDVLFTAAACRAAGNVAEPLPLPVSDLAPSLTTPGGT